MADVGFRAASGLLVSCAKHGQCGLHVEPVWATLGVGRRISYVDLYGFTPQLRLRRVRHACS